MEIKFSYPKLAKVGNEMLTVLKEEGGTREIIMGINNHSMTFLFGEIYKYKYRSEIFGFVLKLVSTWGANIEKVVIYDLINSLFKARVVIKDETVVGTYNLDLHVTDAITLAVTAKCPIFVDELVLAKSEKNTKEDEYDENTKKFLEKLTSKKKDKR